MKKRLLALFLAFVMAMSLLPVSVFADGETGGQLQGTKDNPITANSNGVTVNKYVSGDEKSGYQLTLEAYAENKVTSTTTTTPLDIVLVLDTSGSMANRFDGLPAIWSESRIHALKTAVKSFIDKVAANAVKTEANHQIGIVTFASGASTVRSLTSASSGKEDLKSAVESLQANGATRADYGMVEAKNVLQSAQPTSEKVVIMFTDGEPTSGRSYEEEVAHGAINTAKALKADEVTVYTIGIFSGADPSNISGKTNKYMNAVSSNYPEAVSVENGDRYSIDLKDRAQGQYYFASSSAYGLEDVFNTIANTVTSSTLKVNPDATSVLSDTLSDYFNFPNGLTGEDPQGVTVQKVRVTGKDSGGYTWGNAETVSGAKVTGKTIEVTGFDYKENAVTEETKNGETTYSGYKLVVTFPIEIDKNACNEDTTITDGYYPTNSKAELSYKESTASTTNDTRTTLSDSPKVSYTKPGFTVTWMSQDGKTTLKTDENVTYGTKPSYNSNEPTKPDDDEYTYTFAGWATEPNQTTGVAEENLDKVTSPTTYYAAFSKTEITRYSITINYQDGEGNELKTPHSEYQKVGFEYSFDVSSDTTGTIPFIINKGETQYVFNQIKSGSPSGTVTGAVSITAEYLLDSDKDGTPDKYEATVTYKVVNGTWSDGSTTDKTEKFNLKKFNHTTNAWESANPTLGSTIPTGMKPNSTHVLPGAWKDETPVATTPVTGSKTYTYTFNTSVNSKLTVEKTLEKVNGEVYTTGKVEVGDVLTYTVKVTNTGNVSLSNIVVTDTFTGSAAPTTTTEGVTWTLDPASNSYKATWNIEGTLAAGANATLTYTYTVQAADQGKTITNNAVAKSGTTEGGDTTTVTVYNPDMTVTKAVTKVNNTEVAAGETVVVQKDYVLTYTITVQNTGDQNLTNVVVTDSMWQPGKVTGAVIGNGAQEVTVSSGKYTISTLNVGETVTITYTYTVTDADVKAEKVTNNVSVTSAETPGVEGDGTTTNVVGDYTIEASSGANGSIDPAGSVKVAAGTDQTFTITADAGYHIEDVLLDGVSKGAFSSYTFKNVQANHTIHATFAKNSTPTSYTLYYHSNFGEDVSFYQSSSTRSVTVKEYENVGRLPERDGYVFVSWNTEPDGSGTRYMPGDTFHINGSSDNLYAQWQKDKTGPDDSGVSNWLETDEHRAYLTGYPDNTFRADRNMTRAEVAQMFYALLLDKNVTITKSFSDVPDDAWYATAVKTLASLGMMDGYPDGTFRPDEPITRAEFATVGLAFAYDPLDASCSYYDVGASAWYHTYVAQATTYGWIGGYPDNTFRPGNNITRVEVCVIVNNMLGRDADERYIDRHEDELVHFVDLSDSYWGYYTIMESTNTHEYTGSFTNEKWTDVK